MDTTRLVNYPQDTCPQHRSASSVVAICSRRMMTFMAGERLICRHHRHSWLHALLRDGVSSAVTQCVAHEQSNYLRVASMSRALGSALSSPVGEGTIHRGV